LKQIKKTKRLEQTPTKKKTKINRMSSEFCIKSGSYDHYFNEYGNKIRQVNTAASNQCSNIADVKRSSNRNLVAVKNRFQKIRENNDNDVNYSKANDQELDSIFR